ncbi:hypothetical protein DTO169C6_4172 [Paecilomyces variotii]|nr:hypothetical protein DTO169C6_4172 [Paecilomyces variotii]
MDIIKDLKDTLLICLSGGAYDCDLGEEMARIQKIADDVLTVLLDADCVSEALLSSLIKVLKAGASMGTAVKEAFDKATYEAMGFAREHPMYCAVIALGIMVILTPWCLEALGFGELGPIEGTFAARWQCMYGGYVPKGSLFSYFQRLGMVWKH